MSIKMTVELDARLRSFLRERNMSRSDRVRKAISAFLDQQHDEASPRSVVNLMHDLIGSVRDPEDLSTSKEHMKDYGR
jgi:metal-responsive CopG/Arc/MetJ family transcriptional regulator